MEIVGYHATKKKNVSSIKNNICIKKESAWKNDLGDGFYCYVDEKDIMGKSLNFDDPKENAKKYYESGKNNKAKYMAILEIKGEFNERRILNLSKLDVLSMFNKFKKDLKQEALTKISKDFKIIREEVSEAYDTNDPRARRGVVDGFFIDRYLNIMKTKGYEVEAVMMLTASDFYYLDNHKWRVQIPNGCELCIKKLSCIKSIM